MTFKTIFAFTVIATLATCSFAFAGGQMHKVGHQYFAVGAKSVNCNQHATDVCIVNNSNQTIYFSVPALAQSGQLNPPLWVDVFSNYYYPSLGVTVSNSYGQVIFNQPVPDHSIINVSNYASTNAQGKAKKKLRVSVKH